MTAQRTPHAAEGLRPGLLPILLTLACFGLVACPGGGGHKGGGSSRAPLSTTGPTLESVESPTRELEVVLRGLALMKDSLLRVEGGAAIVEGSTDSGRKDFDLVVPLRPNRRNQLFVTEFFAQGGESPAATIEVIQDGLAPMLYFDYPEDQQTVWTSKVNVSGRVADSLSGFLGLEVRVNGRNATVVSGIGTNGSFDLADLALDEGVPTEIVAVARDAAGNESSRTIEVTREALTGNRIERLSGNNQSAAIHELLDDPLEVRVLRPDGSPLAGKVVTFSAVRSDGRLAPDTTSERRIRTTVSTDASGRARAYWQLGSDAGCGNNRVRAESRDVNGAVDFFASADPGPPTQINIGSGGEQIGAVTGPAPEPLRAWVSDGCNGIAGVAVQFSVVEGGGTLSGGGDYNKSTVTVVTGPTGHAAATLILGGLPGTNLVRATFAGDSSAGAHFVVYGRVENGAGAKSEGGEAAPQTVTTFAGQVLDNAQRPVEGATCTLTVGAEPPLETLTGVDGIFLFHQVEGAGLSSLEIDGSTADLPFGSSIRVPSLHYEPFLLPRVDNTLTRPVLLPLLNSVNDVVYDGTQDLVLTTEGIAGLEMRIKAGSVTLKDGTVPSPTNPVALSLNQVHADDIPMRPGDGAAPPFSWTLQPGGTRFDPPVEIRYPNMSGLPAGAASYFLSFDHDTGRFEIVASGRVSSDGSIISTRPGEGLSVAGWGCNCPPYAVTADCKKCNVRVSGPSEVCIGQTVSYAASAVGAGSITWTASGAGANPTSGAGNSFTVTFASGGQASVVAHLTCTGGLADENGMGVNVSSGECGPNAAVPITYDVTTNTLAPSMSVNATTVVVQAAQSFTAFACADAGAGVWRLRVESVRSPGTINIVPTPAANTPNPTVGGNIVNSAGAAGHYCAVIADLANYNTPGVGGKGPGWHVTQSTIDHENYHWNTEWKGSFNGRWSGPGGEAAMEALTVPLAGNADCDAAMAALLPQANALFAQIVSNAFTDYMALGDSPGDPPYAAGQVALDAMITAIETFASGQGWPNCP